MCSLCRFEGATATAMSDSMALPASTDASRGQSASWNMITSRPIREYQGASNAASWATTAQPVKSMALTGPSNYKYALAQAGEAVAVSFIERSNDDRLAKNLRRQRGDQFEHPGRRLRMRGVW